MAEEKKDEKLDLEEMDQMAGGIGGIVGILFEDPSKAEYREYKCRFCGEVTKVRTDLAFAGILQCSKCRMRLS